MEQLGSSTLFQTLVWVNFLRLLVSKPQFQAARILKYYIRFSYDKPICCQSIQHPLELQSRQYRWANGWCLLLQIEQ